MEPFFVVESVIKTKRHVFIQHLNAGVAARIKIIEERAIFVGQYDDLLIRKCRRPRSGIRFGRCVS